MAKITNFERIKQMDLLEMKNFLWNNGFYCGPYCPDRVPGCAHHCLHNAGKDIIEKWLKEETEVES